MAVVSDGRDEIVKLIGGGLSGTQFDEVHIGDSGSETSDSDSGLLSTVDSHTGLTAEDDGNTMTLVGEFTGNSATIREASVSNSDDVMLARQVIDDVNVEESDTLEVTFNINFSDA